MNKSKQSIINVVLGLLLAFIFSFTLSNSILQPFAWAEASTTSITDTSVGNYSGFSTDVVYQIVTDWFVDGNPLNNPTGAIYDKNNLRKYHGEDWKGITDKLEDNYFTNLGVSALWIAAPVQNSDYIDPSNGCAPYHGY